MAQDDPALVAGLRLVLREDAPECRLDSEHAEERWGHVHGAKLLYGSPVSDRDLLRVVDRLLLECADVAQAVVVVGDAVAGALRARLRVGVEDRRDAVRLGERERAQDHAMHHAEDRDVGPHAQGERDESGDGEALVPAQEPEAKAGVSE